MKWLTLALVTGLSLAAGGLGLGLSPAGSTAELQSTLQHDAASHGHMSRDDYVNRLVAAHTNSNTEKPEWLNANLIRGKATVICTNDQSVAATLQSAIDAWNTVFTVSMFTHSDGMTGGPLEHYNPSRPRNKCELNTDDKDIEVLVRLEPGEGASYYSDKQTSPPRKLFAATDKQQVPIAYRSTAYSTIVLGELRLPTLIHELGHVLGLSDYKTCDGLRIAGTGPAATDPDVRDQHYALMYNADDRECRPPNQRTITDRDLRDLYEAYHVGAVTNVYVPWRTSRSKLSQIPTRPGLSLSCLSRPEGPIRLVGSSA